MFTFGIHFWKIEANTNIKISVEIYVLNYKQTVKVYAFVKI